VQRRLERRIGRHAGDVIVAGLDHRNRATDIGGERDRVLLLVGKPRAFDRRIDRAARLDPVVPRGGHQRIPAAETESQNADGGELELARHVVDPGLDHALRPAVAELAGARLRLLVVGRQRHAVVDVPHRRREA
jgi:hypothetical protein